MSTVALRSIKERETLTRKSQRVWCMNLTPSVSIGLKAGQLKIRSVSFAASAKSSRTTTTGMSTPTALPTDVDGTPQQRITPEECLTCRIIGTGALAGVGFYALQMSRPKAPGSVLGKRIMGGVGVCESLEFKTRYALVFACLHHVHSRSQVSCLPASSGGIGGRSKSFRQISSATTTLE